VKHRTVSGVTPDYPVCQRSNDYFAPTVDCNRIQCATVRARVRARAVGAPDSVRWRTRLFGASCDSSLHQTASLVVVAINTPTTPHSIASKFSNFLHHTRVIAFNSRHIQRDQILYQVRNRITPNQIVTRESDICVQLSSCPWIASFLSHYSCDQTQL
jgi:hypothetical protein